MNPKLTIQIPEPCHEDWNKMTPKDNGSYCGSCEKTVVDFSKMNDTQIAQYVAAHPDEKMCGRFANTQLNRSISHLNTINRSAMKAFVYVLFMVFGASLFAFTYVKNNEDKLMGDVGIERNEGYEGRTVGVMMPILDTVEIDTAQVDTTVIEQEYMTAGLMMAYYEEPLADSVPEIDIISEKYNEYLDMTVGGMMVNIETVDNRIENLDTVSVERKDSVTQEIIDQVKLPTLESYPNPTSGAINIKYNIPQRTDVLIELYDINGNKVKDLVSTSQLYEGTYIYPADLSELSNGTYICRMIAGERSFNTKILVQK
jgi:hypothetical protein